MNAKDIFPSEEERAEVKGWLDLFKGSLTQVIDKDGKVLFRSNLCIDT